MEKPQCKAWVLDKADLAHLNTASDEPSSGRKLADDAKEEWFIQETPVADLTSCSLSNPIPASTPEPTPSPIIPSPTPTPPTREPTPKATPSPTLQQRQTDANYASPETETDTDSYYAITKTNSTKDVPMYMATLYSSSNGRNTQADADYACITHGDSKANTTYSSSNDNNPEADTNSCHISPNDGSVVGDASANSDACYAGSKSCSDLSKTKLGVYGCVNSFNDICDGCDWIKHAVDLCRCLRGSYRRNGSDRLPKQSHSMRTWTAKLSMTRVEIVTPV
ncbi:hypothetical protein FI667_g4347, partial [Globisporangium splendens]